MKENLLELQKTKEALEEKLVESANSALDWIKKREKITRSIRMATNAALSAGDVSRLREVIEGYSELRKQSYSAFVPMLNESNEDGLTVEEAIAVAPAVYDLLDLWPDHALRHPALGRVLLALRQGRDDPKLGSACQELLVAVTRKIAEPVRQLTEFDLFVRLRVYETVLQILQFLWKKHEKSLPKIYKEFPLIKELHESTHYVADLKQKTASLTALNLLARFFNTNVNDLKRGLAEARRIKKALRGVNIEDIIPMEIADFFTLAEYKMGQSDTVSTRRLSKRFLGDSSRAQS